jgi:hypothetical protein
MTTEQKRPDENQAVDDEVDEPSEEEIEREKHKEQTWKHDDDKELTGPDGNSDSPMQKAPQQRGFLLFHRSSRCGNPDVTPDSPGLSIHALSSLTITGGWPG